MNEAEKEQLRAELKKLTDARKRPQKKPKGINFHLLILVAALVAALAAATLYFIWSYGTIAGESKMENKERVTLESRLGQCTTDLNTAMGQMSAMSEDLNISASTREALNQLYTNLSDVRSRLEGELASTQGSLSSCRTELQSASDELEESIEELNDYVEKYRQREATWQAAQTQITILNLEIDELSSVKTDLSKRITKLENCIAAHANCSECKGI